VSTDRSRTFNIEWINNIVIQKFKVLVTKPVLNVPLAASKEVVDDGHFMSLQHQLVNQVRSNEASTTSNLYMQHFTVVYY